MKYSNIPAAQLLVLSCKAAGIKDIVISPGSRNAPLTISFTSDSFFNCYSIVDERCAAFFALGMAQYQNKPTAVVCTSGSALLNYYPAIAEAFYSKIPLVVISADRPPYKIDVGDGQTIRQDNVFDRHIGYSANLKIDVSHAVDRLSFYAPDYLEHSQDTIGEYNQKEIIAAFETLFSQKLPAHINIPFEEPLYDKEELRKGSFPPFSWNLHNISNELKFEDVQKIWNKAERKMVLVGVSPPNQINQDVLDILAQDPSVIVFTETTSNLHHSNFFPSIDSIIFPIEKSTNRHERFLQLQPELLLTFGGMVVSKKVKAFLRKYKPKHHWHIDPSRAFDTYFSLTKHYATDANSFLKELLKKQKSVESNYFNIWNAVKEGYVTKRDEYLKKIPFSDFQVFNLVQRSIPNNIQVHLSNSSTIRYFQLFPMVKSNSVYCNRGTSGIDGSTSTAIGASIHCTEQTLLITGDLSFFYDSNALWNDHIPNSFRIVVINNAGGGIFRILPGFDGSDRFSTFFETKHEMTAEHICEQFGLEYSTANDEKQLSKELGAFFQVGEKPKVLEVFTPRKVNNDILLGYFDFISSEYK